MRSLLFGIILICSFGSSFGKSVDENTARIVGSNYCKNQGVVVFPDELSLIYKATSAINGAEVTDFYVLSRAGSGFVIVSGDDQVTPVLAWSADAPFNANNIPAHVAYWLNGYQQQINYVIKNNITASISTTGQWNDLKVKGQSLTAAKITGGVVSPLIKTRWSQDPYFNEMCPFDAVDSAHTITGCVATAMAQVMKYWNWPRVGVGSHSYYMGTYGLLAADFGTHTYRWDSMPVAVFKSNNYVATLMSDAGISVNMNYGVHASGAQVLSAFGGSNCTQYAMEHYFSYKPIISGEMRSSYTDTNWVHMLKGEIDAKRPVIYTGFGSSGGHCFIADGYKTDNFIHFNWGWGFAYDGFYIVEQLMPGSSDFTNNQAVLINVEPDSSIVAAVTTVSNVNNTGIYPNPANDVVNVKLNGATTTVIRIMDISGRELKTVTPPNNVSVVTIPVSDFSTGIYLLEVASAEGVTRKKIVITH